MTKRVNNNDNLKRLVDLKIFELQSLLLSVGNDKNQNQKIYNFCLQWLLLLLLLCCCYYYDCYHCCYYVFSIIYYYICIYVL